MGNMGLFIIKTFQPNRTCARVNVNRFATSKWLSTTYMQHFKNSDPWSAPEFMNRVQKDVVLECNRDKAYKAKKLANQAIEGSYIEQYAALWDYGAELKASDPGSTVEFEVDNDSDGNPIFIRMYICFQGCKASFSHCRSVIGVSMVVT